MNKEELLASSTGTTIIVDFWASWCNPCKTLIPWLDEESESAGDSVQLLKINVDENQALAREFDVMGIPTVFALEDGEIVDSFTGLPTREELSAFFDGLATV